MNGILQQILGELKDIKGGQIRIEKKLDSIHEHTAKITEDIDFLKHKEHQTEEDLFKLKKNLQIIK